MSTKLCSVLHLVIILALTYVQRSEGHGYMIDPAGRSSLWRINSSAPINYNDNALRCGGSKIQCGVCGDSPVGPKENEAGGRFARGIIARTYTEGQKITVGVVITANHMGFFVFHLCVNNDVRKKAKEECFQQNLLQIDSPQKTRYNLPGTKFGRVDVTVQLPPGVTCTQCILRWRWKVGNSWGFGPMGGCLGCGPQEQFYSCADISIVGRSGSNLNPPRTTPRLPVVTTTRQLPTKSYKTESTTALPKTTPTYFNRLTTKANKPPHTILICRGVNLWSGDPQLDKWCSYNCNNGITCPAIFCACASVYEK